jgi:hypothetical protein
MEVFMKKKIALVLILVIVINCIAWAGENDVILIAGAIGAGTIILVGILGIYLMSIAEADTPDDGLRLASLSRSQAVSETGLGPALNVLQHVDLGVTPEKKAYVGLRFQF